MSLIARIRCSLQNLESCLHRWAALHLNNHSHQDFALDIPHDTLPEKCDSGSSVLDEIFSPTLYAVPKHRRSRERRMTRKFGKHVMEKFIQIKTNLIMCLECGTWHEKRTICGNCYKRAKEETEEMKKGLGEDMKYTPDQKEVVFVYKGEDTPTYKGKHIVEMTKPRPKWFSDALMTRVKTSNNS